MVEKWRNRNSKNKRRKWNADHRIRISSFISSRVELRWPNLHQLTDLADHEKVTVWRWVWCRIRCHCHASCRSLYLCDHSNIEHDERLPQSARGIKLTLKEEVWVDKISRFCSRTDDRLACAKCCLFKYREDIRLKVLYSNHWWWWWKNFVDVLWLV